MPGLTNVSLRIDKETLERARKLIIPLLQSPRHALGMSPKRASILRLAIIIGLQVLEQELDEFMEPEN